MKRSVVHVVMPVAALGALLGCSGGTSSRGDGSDASSKGASDGASAVEAGPERPEDTGSEPRDATAAEPPRDAPDASSADVDGRVDGAAEVQSPKSDAADASPQPSDAADAPAREAWTGTWAASPQGCSGAFIGKTLRQVVHTSVSGRAARVRLVNTFGKGPLRIRDVHVARRTTGSSIDGATDRALLFGGLSDVTIAAGQLAVSDAADFAVPELADVTVSFFVVAHDGVTCHSSAFQTNYVATGDVAANATLTGAETSGSYSFLSNLDVLATDVEGAVVTLGASITDGYSAPGDANRRWPNDLAVRLSKAGRKVGVLNQGISGDGAVNAGARFARDVVSQPGVRWVIFADCPVNDLGNSNPAAATEIDRIKALIAAAHTARLTFLCATLTPFEGAGYWSAEKETGRAAINAFIRGAGNGCDGVIDLDAATHDPAHPTRYLPAYDAGDHLHPNADGLQAIANAVGLELFR